ASITSPATTTVTFHDVSVSPAGAVLMVGEESSAGRIYHKTPNGTWTNTVPSMPPLRKVWQWAAYPVAGALREDYLIGAANGTLWRTVRNATTSAAFSMGTSAYHTLPGGTPVSALWFHDRKAGLAAT